MKADQKQLEVMLQDVDIFRTRYGGNDKYIVETANSSRC